MFKHYAKEAEFDLTHLSTIQLFAMGFKNRLQDAILHQDTQPNTIEGYITTAQAEIQKYQNQQAIKFPGHTKFQWIGGHQPLTPWTYQPQHQPWNMAYQRPIHRNDQPVFMDIDKPSKVFAQMRHATDAQKQDYQARGACFNCGKQGHMAKHCPERKAQLFKLLFQPNCFANPQQSFPLKLQFAPRQPFASRPLFKPTFQRKPFTGQAKQKCPQGFRKFNKLQAYQYIQQACTATIEKMEQAMEEEEYQGYDQGYKQEYKQEDVYDLATQTSRLSKDQQGNLLEEMIKADPDF